MTQYCPECGKQLIYSDHCIYCGDEEMVQRQEENRRIQELENERIEEHEQNGGDN